MTNAELDQLVEDVKDNLHPQCFDECCVDQRHLLKALAAVRGERDRLQGTLALADKQIEARDEYIKVLTGDYTVSLRDRIKHVIDCVEDQDDSVRMDAAADAILALVRAHLTSDEALDRFAMIAWQSIQMIDPKVNREEMPRALREAIRTALNDTATLGEGE